MNAGEGTIVKMNKRGKLEVTLGICPLSMLYVTISNGELVSDVPGKYIITTLTKEEVKKRKKDAEIKKYRDKQAMLNRMFSCLGGG